MSTKREIARARRQLEFILRATVRLLATPTASGKDINGAIEHLLTRVGPGEGGTDVLAELIRRGEYVPSDGYPSQSMADSDIHGGFAQTGSTSTERAALRWGSESEEDAISHQRPVERDDPDRQLERDVAGDKLVDLVTSIDSAATVLGHADRDRKFLLSIQWRQHDPEEADAPVKCSLCERVVTNFGNDRLRSLYCYGCYHAWLRAGSPQDPVERRRFELDRLERLRQKEGEAVLHLNPQAPAICAYAHVCCSEDVRRSEEHKHWRSSAECGDCAAVREAEAS